MKLHLADAASHYTFTGYGPGYLVVNGTRHEQPLLVSPGRPPVIWPVAQFEDLSTAAILALLENRPEIIVLGTGPKQRFAAPAVIRPLIEAGIGMEMMNTPAACRTYNILTGEGRHVLAAMFLP